MLLVHYLALKLLMNESWIGWSWFWEASMLMKWRYEDRAIGALQQVTISFDIVSRVEDDSLIWIA